MKRALAIAIALLLPAGAFAQQTLAGPSELKNAIQDVLEAFHEDYGFPGATVAVVNRTGDIDTVAVGMADVEANTPMRPESRMLAASIGKTVWGALTLSLEADGSLDRSDLVSVYLGSQPWFAHLPNADTMTVGQLLTHTSGLPDHVHMDGAAEALIALGETSPFDPAKAVALVLDAPPLFEAGTAWAYTDTGYLLLGLVIEAATGESVFSLAQDRLLAPVGLRSTTPSDAPELEGLAVGYTTPDNPFGLPVRTMDETGKLTWNPAIEWTGGGFASTSADLALWGNALFTGRVLPSDYLPDLRDGVSVHADAPGVFYGSGVAIYQGTPYGTVLGHGGWIPGYVSSLRHYADHDLTIAFQINSDVGVVDDSTDLVPALEAALAEVVLGTASQ
ncbi:serine hydrolase [Alphaproteobacteria bacterium GH1-50]|uniref:Serine hydrolase n=1 Tax=Kangsaoukella pontilimi TaxID=2691042 RepID=A0A7C9MDN4_9RHOB|nr:serine hydrolase domain-containing protein [Kangsaoukella pontilimi]MXQ06596.1 serine hydrolase [Kangsaoukella pontilimi]